MNKSIIGGLIFFMSFLSLPSSYGCESTIAFVLENNKGGVYAGQSVNLLDNVSGITYKAVSDSKGAVKLSVPCATSFKVSISNYSKSFDLVSPKEGGISNQTLSYSPDMIKKAAMFAMNTAEIAKTDEFIKTIPDTFTYLSIQPFQRQNPVYFVKLILVLHQLDGKPLANEAFTYTGLKRGKRFKGFTSKAGTALIYLPKGDTYQLDFPYTKDFANEFFEYSKGMSESEMSYSYLGSVEIVRRQKLEAIRIAAEEARLKKEKEEFEAWCKARKVSKEEGMRLKLKESIVVPDTVVLAVLSRNNWKDKLIVCDLTGSMSPFAQQLSLWYQLAYKKENNLQFVFFNDGDNQADNMKVIGKTGGIYYTPSKGLDSLRNFMAKVSSKGSGGDCPENNMEALINGVKMAKPFKDLIMIADNYAPVKDIQLLKDFKVPVHIILCGAVSGYVLTDYLDIARKTGGSVHTIEEDIINLASINEGQEVLISGKKYRVMGGKFVAVQKT